MATRGFFGSGLSKPIATKLTETVEQNRPGRQNLRAGIGGREKTPGAAAVALGMRSNRKQRAQKTQAQAMVQTRGLSQSKSQGSKKVPLKMTAEQRLKGKKF